MNVSNDRYLNTPEKLHSKLNAMEKKQEGSLSTMTILHGTEKVCNEFPKGSFPRLLWDEQMKAASLKNAKSMRWRGGIRWLLNGA